MCVLPIGVEFFANRWLMWTHTDRKLQEKNPKKFHGFNKNDAKSSEIIWKLFNEHLFYSAKLLNEIEP